MIEKPDWIIGFERPQGTEIKYIGNNWYLYERLSVYDKKTHKKKKKSGKIIGKITPDGLVPSRRQAFMKDISELKIDCVEHGASNFLASLTVDMRARLKEQFPDCWKEIYAMAMMKCKERSDFKRMDFHYQTSSLKLLLGDLRLSNARITNLLKRIGADREHIATYMKQDIPASGLIMFDGHRLLSSSESMEFARLGYDSKCRFMPQVNLQYMFSYSGCSKFPVFYKQFAGDIPDVTAFCDILKESAISKSDVIIIADKGYDSEFNEELVREAGLGYILAVRRGCSEVTDIPKSVVGYQKVFTFRGRAIYCNEYSGKDENTYLYFDMELANDEAVDFITRKEKINSQNALRRAAEDKRRARNRGRLNESEYAALAPIDVAVALQQHATTGTFVLKTNRKEINCAQAYFSYKTRQDIEQAFKTYDNTLDAKASYMRDQLSFEAWLFINHLALQMLYAVLQTVFDKNLSDRYSFEDIMAFLKHIRLNNICNQWIVSNTTKKTKTLCDKLGIDVTNSLVAP